MRPDRAADVIMACVILHNISKDLRQPEVAFNLQEEEEWQQPLENVRNGAAARNLIIQDHFTQ